MEDLSNRKQERQARRWGYNKLIGLTGIVNAFESGCQSAYEASEFLEVTVEYLQECIDGDRDKSVSYTHLDVYKRQPKDCFFFVSIFFHLGIPIMIVVLLCKTASTSSICS